MNIKKENNTLHLAYSEDDWKNHDQLVFSPDSRIILPELLGPIPNGKSKRLPITINGNSVNIFLADETGFPISQMLSAMHGMKDWLNMHLFHLSDEKVMEPFNMHIYLLYKILVNDERELVHMLFSKKK